MIEEVGQSAVATRAVLADAHEHLGNSREEPSARLERPDHAANGPVRGRLVLIGQVTVDQPVAERRRPEPKNLQPIADRNLGTVSAVRRAKQSRRPGKFCQNSDDISGRSTLPLVSLPGERLDATNASAPVSRFSNGAAPRSGGKTSINTGDCHDDEPSEDPRHPTRACCWETSFTTESPARRHS